MAEKRMVGRNLKFLTKNFVFPEASLYPFKGSYFPSENAVFLNGILFPFPEWCFPSGNLKNLTGIQVSLKV